LPRGRPPRPRDALDRRGHGLRRDDVRGLPLRAPRRRPYAAARPDRRAAPRLHCPSELRGNDMTTITTEHTTGTPSDFLRVTDLTALQLHELLDLAAAMKADTRAWVDTFRGETLAMLFEKHSTRTRVSLATAAARLGMTPLTLSSGELHLSRGEPVADTAQVLSAYVAAITVRTYSHELLEQLAEAA